MAAVRTLLLIAALCLAGCSTTTGHGYGKHYAGSRCPAGTVLICLPDTRRGCRCGPFLVR